MMKWPNDESLANFPFDLCDPFPNRVSSSNTERRPTAVLAQPGSSQVGWARADHLFWDSYDLCDPFPNRVNSSNTERRPTRMRPTNQVDAHRAGQVETWDARDKQWIVHSGGPPLAESV